MKTHAVLNSTSMFIYKKKLKCIQPIFSLFSYDAVDKALLNVPHMIKKVNVSIRKGDRNNRSEHIPPAKIIQKVDSSNTGVGPRKPILKQVQIGMSNTLIYSD
jgi:hypothetical protein